MKVLIIGAGLFGSVAAKLCRRDGVDATVIDGSMPYPASLCSACLFKPSWLESLNEKQARIGWEVLEKLYKVETLRFCASPGLFSKNVDINWIDPASILVKPDGINKVLKIHSDGKVETDYGLGAGRNGLLTDYDRVLVAAGIHSSALVETPPIKALMGVSLWFPAQLEQPQLRIYAPYKQAIAFNINSKEVWMGDGTSILQENWEEQERISSTLNRAVKYFGLGMVGGWKARIGARPYVEGFKNGYFKRVHDNVWVSTGGAKNGTLLAAYQAQLFLESI